MKKIFHSVLSSLCFLALISSTASADVIIPKAPTDFFIRFKRGVSPSEANRFVQSNQMRIVWTSRLVPGLVRAVPTSRSLLQNRKSLTQVSNDARVQYFEGNTRNYRRIQRAPAPVQNFRNLVGPRVTGNDPTDPKYPAQWALVGEQGIHPRDAWMKTTGDSRIRVAIMDTGIDAKHPELQDRVLPGYDFINKSAQVGDSHGHGTHVSGVIGARWDNKIGIAGINREVSLIPIRVVPDNGDETDSNLIEGFEFAVAQGARVANCSFGKAVSSQAVGDVIEAAGQKGLLVVVAAGNDGQNNNSHAAFPANFRTSNMVVVAASTSSGNRANFSNFGLTKVDVAAPGAAVLSTITGGGYASWDGTSMATPQVVGVAALVLSVNPSLSPQQVREILIHSVDEKPAFKGKIDSGGVINAAKAVEAASHFRGNLHLR